MPVKVEYIEIDHVLVPKKLRDYATFNIQPEFFKAAINWYVYFGRMKPEDVMDYLEKYQNMIVNSFSFEGKEWLIGTPEGEEYIIESVEKYVNGVVFNVSIRRILEYFKPMVHAFCDPSYILYSLAFRRPQIYNVILAKENGFEWVKRLCLRIRQRLGMNDPKCVEYMMNVAEVTAVLPMTRQKGKDKDVQK